MGLDGLCLCSNTFLGQSMLLYFAGLTTNCVFAQIHQLPEAYAGAQDTLPLMKLGQS